MLQADPVRPTSTVSPRPEELMLSNGMESGAPGVRKRARLRSTSLYHVGMYLLVQHMSMKSTRRPRGVQPRNKEPPTYGRARVVRHCVCHI